MANDSNLVPSFTEFKRLSARGNLIPLYIELVADLETPVSAFLKVTTPSDSSFLLESVEHGEKIGRYSFIGIRPSAVIQGRANQPVDVLSEIEKRMNRYHLVRCQNLPEFCGGFVGYLSYENVSYFEKIRFRRKKSLNIPTSVFLLTDKFLVFDHIDRTLKLVVLCETSKGSRRAYREGVEAIQEMSHLLSRSLDRSHRTEFLLSRQDEMHCLKPNMTRREFESRVNKIKKYIRQGDCIQVVFSQNFDLGKVRDEFSIYRALRFINPSPYMFFLRHKELCLIGSSPEVLVKKSGTGAHIRPIAGTRPRGRSEEEDLSLERDLRNSRKEMAEHLMLVDLGRNDLGRVCKYKSVQVKDFARIERYSHVMHLVSEVTGQLKPGRNSFTLLRATFPAGTVSGAPKVRAMQIIDELEDTERGPYAGCLGYFSFTGDMDMCIMIRTILSNNHRASVQAGAGIVFDSIPSREFLETVNKAQALFNAVESAKRRRGGTRH